AKQEPLLSLHPRLVGHHAVEALAGELATPPLDEAHVRREPAEVAVAERCAEPPEPERRIPAGVEARDPWQSGQALRRSLLRVGQCARALEVLVDRLAGHVEMHDLARALEDQIDPAVAQEPLDADRRLPAPLERALGLVTAAATNLQRTVHQLPGAHGVPLLGGSGLEADVIATAIRHLARQPPDGIHREGRRRHVGDLMRDRLVLPDGRAPLLPRGGPAPADLETALGESR